MNIFYLDHSPEKAAEYCCDKHCVKMILESAQLLCTARILLGGPAINGYSFKPTHINHPSAIWVRQSKDNYDWLYNHLLGLCREYTKRYGKIHMVEREGLLQQLSNAPSLIPLEKFSEPPQCMPVEYKDTESAVRAYRLYYIKEKSRFAKWRAGNIPNWYIINS